MTPQNQQCTHLFSSQFFEDAWIHRHLNDRPFGVFADVGAFDGITGSNTLFFERLGWTGFLVEPDPIMGEVCRKNRKEPTFVCAVGNGDDEQKFYVNQAERGTSRLCIPPAWVPCDPKVITVQVRRLDHLMEDLGITHLDLLSVDTEGTELDVLATLGEHRPKIIIAEFWSQPNPPAPEPILAWARANGYVEVHRTTANLILQHK